MIRGLDVSVAQGVIDWSLVPAEIAFVVIKATEGTGYRDPTLARNMIEAHRTGRAWAPYLFCRPSQEPIAQIRNLWDALGDTMPDFRVALDLESAPDAMTPGELVLWFLKAADEAERYFGVPPLVYTYPWYERTRIAPAVRGSIADRLGRCPLWIADYSKGERPAEGASPFVPAPWTTWTMWQTSGNGSSHVPGIAGAVDHDVFNGDADALRAFRGLPPPPPSTRPDILHPPVPLGGIDDD